jgi:hypothetical protein
MTPRRVAAMLAMLLLSGAACGSHPLVTTPDAATLAAMQAGKLKIKFVRIRPAVPVPK